MALATDNGYTYGVRKALVNRGIADSDIGYDKTTGYVTVGGQKFIKPEKNYQGTTFTTEQNFNNAWNEYQKNLNKNAGTTGTTGTTTNYGYTPQDTSGYTTYSPYNTQNPYDQQLRDLINTLTQQAQNPVAVDVNQIYASPQYAAYQAQAQRSAQQGIRAAQEALGAAGFGRSTALAERAQGIQNDATNYLNTQVLPQLMAQAQAERQQQLQNQLSVLNQLAQQQGVYDTRFNNANELALRKGQLTGSFMDPQAIEIANKIIQLGEQWKMAPDQATRDALHAEANNYRAILQSMGYDPNLFGANLSTEQRQANIGKIGIPTMEARQLEFQKAQQEWENMFRQQQFDEEKAARLWEQAFKEKSFAQEVKDAAAARGLQWANLNQRQKEFIADQAFREKQFQLELDKFNASQGGSQITDKESNDNFNMIFDDLQTPGVTKEQARQLLQANRDFLNDSDYAKLNSWINENL